MKQRRTVFFVSDQTGVTAETMGHSLLTQFDGMEFRPVTLPFITTLDKAQVRPLLFFIGIQPHTDFEAELLESGYLDKGYNPLSLNPRTIRKMMYNPAPLDRLLARTCLEAWDSGTENVGAEVFRRLEQKIRR